MSSESRPTSARTEIAPPPQGGLIDPLQDGALEVVRTLRAAGHEALFAGGCVRDQVLGLAPKDWDVATSARPEAVLALFPRAIPVGVQFGVVRVIVRGQEYEVATFRADGDYADGRRPTSVTWASAREDVLRRDFTINGLLQDPLAEGGPRILDFVGGLEDLSDGLIRAIGEPRLRFEEDYLRLIRAVRFAARLGFRIDAATWDAVSALAHQIVRVSAERIREELDRLFSEGGSARGLALANESGLLGHVLPELAAERVPEAIARLTHLGRCDELLGWGVALWDLGPEARDAVDALGLRLKMSRAFTRALGELVETGHRIAAWDGLGMADRKRALRLGTGSQAVVLAGLAGHRQAEHRAKEALLAWDEVTLRPAPLISGEDLKAVGFAPGPAFRAALEAVETAQLELRLADREAALALAREVVAASPPNLHPRRR